MKKIIIIILTTFLITSCGRFESYPTTTFSVINDSNETISFSSTVVVFPMSKGPQTRNFSIRPKDSILARQVGFKEGVEPQKWFLEFNIFPNENVKLFDPNKAENWIKGINSKGETNYTFVIAE